jgi:hypothetical protein
MTNSWKRDCYMIFIWFSDADDSQNVTNPVLQNTRVDSILRQVESTNIEGTPTTSNTGIA